jgi:predicted O-linked N-acetylglucosamine transferase (SPINDLY family)
VADQGLDILFYPDLGMDPFTYTLAFTRLAPVQCVTWGHPVTTGIPGMDFYLSSQDLETEDGDKHYTEKLIRLATPAVYYSRPARPSSPKGRGSFGLPEKGHVYACPQTPFKFHPDFDGVLGGILRRDPEGILVLVESRYPTWRDLLWQRFERTLPDVRQRIHFVPRLGRPDFLSLLAIADVLLDPIHFGGGNTSFEGLGLGIPIVTLPSNFLRGRITYALYRKMGLMDCVASSPEDYIERAVHLGTDPAWRTTVRKQIQEKCGVLFEDAAAVHALEDFFQKVAKLPS